MRRALVIAVGSLGLLLVIAELAAVPLATRVIGGALGRCVAYDQLEVTAVARPVVPRLLVGRARDVELHATGVSAGDVRVADAHLRMDTVVLPWAPGTPDPSTAVLRLRMEETDVERALRSWLPGELPIEVQLRSDVASLGAAVLPVTLDLEVQVDRHGTVVLRPVRGGEVLERLGVARSFASSDAVRVAALDIGDGEVTGTFDLEVVPGVSGEGCSTPLAGGAVVGPVAEPRS